MQQDILKVMLSEQQLAERIQVLGQQISRDYAGKDLLLLSVLKGSVVFLADLMRCITIPLEIDFMIVSSYGNSTKSSGVVKIIKDTDINLADKHVLVVEDILDSGKTLAFLKETIEVRDPASFRIVTLLDKPSRREVELQPDYCGFEVPDEFIIGYGLDYAELYRNLPYIGVLKPEVYARYDDIDQE